MRALYVFAQQGRIAGREGNLEIDVAQMLVGGDAIPVQYVLLDGAEDEAVILESLLLGRGGGCTKDCNAGCQQDSKEYAFVCHGVILDSRLKAASTTGPHVQRETRTPRWGSI